MNILLPTDFSKNSRNAADYALQLFQEVPCNFHLLHVIPVPGDKLAAGYLNISPNVQAKFDELLDWLESIKTNPQHQFHIAFKANYLIEAVRQQVQEKNIDLILMGTKGSTNKAGAVIGKNTSDVMMKVKCPVLAISGKAVFKKHREVLFPTDYKIQYNNKMLETLLNLTSISKASVKILELFNSEKEPSAEQLANRSFLQSTFGTHPPMLQTFYTSQSKDKAISNIGKDVDMIVMAAKNLNICHKLLQNHQNNKIPFINELPLLILH